jgi:hypothetical protein
MCSIIRASARQKTPREGPRSSILLLIFLARPNLTICPNPSTKMHQKSTCFLLIERTTLNLRQNSKKLIKTRSIPLKDQKKSLALPKVLEPLSGQSYPTRSIRRTLLKERSYTYMRRMLSTRRKPIILTQRWADRTSMKTKPSPNRKSSSTNH